MEGRKHHRSGKPNNFRGEGGKRGNGHGDTAGGGALGGGFGRGGGRGRKKSKFQMDVCPQRLRLTQYQIDICPQRLRFTQDSISNKFKPPFEYLYIDVAVQQIQQRLLSPAQMPPLNVVNHKGMLWSLDNRRLWVFRKAGVELITVNLVPTNFSPRSSEFFTNLNEDLEKIYSNPMYYPRVRGVHGKISYPDHVNNISITSVETTLPPFPKRSPEQKFIPKSKTSHLVNITNDAAKEKRSYLLLPGFPKEGEGSKPGNMSSPDRTYGTGIIGAVTVASIPKPSPEPKVMTSVSVIPKPKFIPNGHQHQHHHIIYVGNRDPYVSLPSSEKEAATENVVIRFMKKLFRKVCGFIKHCMACLV